MRPPSSRQATSAPRRGACNGSEGDVGDSHRWRCWDVGDTHRGRGRCRGHPPWLDDVAAMSGTPTVAMAMLGTPTVAMAMLGTPTVDEGRGRGHPPWTMLGTPTVDDVGDTHRGRCWGHPPRRSAHRQRLPGRTVRDRQHRHPRRTDRGHDHGPVDDVGDTHRGWTMSVGDVGDTHRGRCRGHPPWLDDVGGTMLGTPTVDDVGDTHRGGHPCWTMSGTPTVAGRCWRAMSGTPTVAGRCSVGMLGTPTVDEGRCRGHPPWTMLGTPTVAMAMLGTPTVDEGRGRGDVGDTHRGRGARAGTPTVDDVGDTHRGDGGRCWGHPPRRSAHRQRLPGRTVRDRQHRHPRRTDRGHDHGPGTTAAPPMPNRRRWPSKCRSAIPRRRLGLLLQWRRASHRRQRGRGPRRPAHLPVAGRGHRAGGADPVQSFRQWATS